MGWLKQCYKSLFENIASGPVFSRGEHTYSTYVVHRRLKSDSRSSVQTAYQKWPYRLQAAIIAGSLLTPLFLYAPMPVHAASAAAPSPAWQSVFHRMSDAELAQISAQGFDIPRVASDRLFDHVSMFSAGGNAVSMLGDMATLLNPPLSPLLALLDMQIRYTSMLFNPSNPGVISDTGGVTIIRIPHENRNTSTTIRDSTGVSYGTVDIRGIDRGGTVLVITRH